MELASIPITEVEPAQIAQAATCALKLVFLLSSVSLVLTLLELETQPAHYVLLAATVLGLIRLQLLALPVLTVLMDTWFALYAPQDSTAQFRTLDL